MNTKYPAFEKIKRHLFQIEVLKDIILNPITIDTCIFQ